MASNPVLDKRHLVEYLLFGTVAALLYMIPVVIFLYKHDFASLYYLFMGCTFFMVPIFFYCFKLLYTRYDKKRAVSILLAGHAATITGVILSCMMVTIAMFIFNSDLFSKLPVGEVLPGAPAQSQSNVPAHLLMMMLATATIGNFGTGSFISIIVSYANKRDQTGDRPVEIGKQQPGNI